jgi:predicted TIM-barrel fold metal-dependent hydrolase
MASAEAQASANPQAATRQAAGAATQASVPEPPWKGPIIDIHQHTNYHGRTDAALLHHQKRMGIAQTVLLPSGSAVNTPATLAGKANGLYAGAGGMQTVVPIAEAHPKTYYFFANEVPDLDGAPKIIESWLKKGAIGIGEQKFDLACDSKEMQAIYAVAQEYQVPVLMHWRYEMFNTGFERFGAMLSKWPKVTFIAHAQTFWANIDARAVQKVLYPRGKVTPGGISDRYLSDYPNFFGDMSAGSGLNALTRDEDHARGFLDRHQDKLLYGSDCSDVAGFGPTCTGAQCISAITRLAPSREICKKIFHSNAVRLLKL